MKNKKNTSKGQSSSSNKDIQFSYEVADADDLEALQKAEAADKRQENRNE